MADDFTLQVGSENWVVLIDGGDTLCSLNARVCNDKVEYFVENNGDLSDDFEDYNAALDLYARICFQRSNHGIKSAYC
jgi:hypothetical protein